MAPQSLYTVLAEPAPESAEPGETSITRAKETLDDDREAVWSGGFGRSELTVPSCASTPNAASLYTLLAEEAPATSEPGETTYTATKETVDNDREAFAPGLLDG